MSRRHVYLSRRYIRARRLKWRTRRMLDRLLYRPSWAEHHFHGLVPYIDYCRKTWGFVPGHRR